MPTRRHETQPFRTKQGSIAQNLGKIAILSVPRQPFRTKWGSIAKNWSNIVIFMGTAQPFRTKWGLIVKNWGYMVLLCSSSSFTWVIVSAYLRHVERFFSVRFWHLGLLVFKLFTWDEVISTDMNVIDWYISYSSGNKYLVVNIGSIQMRSKLNRCKIIFFWEKVKFMRSLCILRMWFWKFLMKIVLMFMRYSETCMNFIWSFYVVSMWFLCSFYVVSM